jgi:hypothetical protein
MKHPIALILCASCLVQQPASRCTNTGAPAMQLQDGPTRRCGDIGKEAQRSRCVAAARPAGCDSGGPLLRCGFAPTLRVAVLSGCCGPRGAPAHRRQYRRNTLPGRECSAGGRRLSSERPSFVFRLLRCCGERATADSPRHSISEPQRLPAACILVQGRLASRSLGEGWSGVLPRN